METIYGIQVDTDSLREEHHKKLQRLREQNTDSPPLSHGNNQSSSLTAKASKPARPGSLTRSTSTSALASTVASIGKASHPDGAKKHPPLPTKIKSTTSTREYSSSSSKSLASSPTLRPALSESSTNIIPIDHASVDSSLTRPLFGATHHHHPPPSHHAHHSAASTLLNATAAAHSPALLGKHLYDAEHRLPGSVPWLSLPGAIATPTPGSGTPPTVTPTAIDLANTATAPSGLMPLTGTGSGGGGGRRRSDGGVSATGLVGFATNQMAPNRSARGSQQPEQQISFSQQHGAATPTSLLAAHHAHKSNSGSKRSTPLTHHQPLLHHQDLAVLGRTGSPMTAAFSEAVSFPPYLRTPRTSNEALQSTMMERSFSNPSGVETGSQSGATNTAPVSPFLLPKASPNDAGSSMDRTLSSPLGNQQQPPPQHVHHHLPMHHGSSKLAGGASTTNGGTTVSPSLAGMGSIGGNISNTTATSQGPASSAFFRTGTPLANLSLPHLTSPPKLHPSFGSASSSGAATINPYFDLSHLDAGGAAVAGGQADSHGHAASPAGASKA